jgi:hypothetical protein
MKGPLFGLAHGLDDLEGACLCFADVDVTHDDVWIGWCCLMYLAKKTAAVRLRLRVLKVIIELVLEGIDEQADGCVF